MADFNGDGFADQAVGTPGEDIGTIVDAGAVNVIYGSVNGLTARNDFWHQNRDGIPEVAETADEFGFALAAGDFNDDGFSDLAVGTPGESIGAVLQVGAVIVIYGSPTGLNAGLTALHGADILSQGAAGSGSLIDLLDVGETGDRFGSAVAAGNFNFESDGSADLAIGTPGEDNDSGSVNIVYGSGVGLTATGEQFFTQGSPNIEDSPGSNDQFGFALATGYFNGDDNADLAIGVPGESGDAGAVSVIYSAGAAGLSATAVAGVGAADQLWDQGPLIDSAENGDRFGQALAAADFNADGFGDLAVGVPTETISASDDGAVNVIFGQLAGLNATGNVLFTQANSGETNEENDQFGFSLAAGDFDHDGFVDLAIGIPFEDVGAVVNAGAVAVRYTALFPQIFTQGTAGIFGGVEAFDEFGEHLMAGDFNGDGAADLAVGVPGDNIGLIDNAGALNVIYGDPSLASGGLGTTFLPSQIWDQLKLGQGVAERLDRFGGGPVTPSSLNFLALAVSQSSNSPPPVAAAGEEASPPATPPAPPAAAVAAAPVSPTPPTVELPAAEEENEADSTPVFSSLRHMLFSLFASARKHRRGL